MSNVSANYHHIEIHTIKPEHLLDLFENIYHFQLIGKRQTDFYSQWFLQSGRCRLIISSILNLNVKQTDSNHYDILTSILSQPSTADYIFDRDTVFNVALQVKSIQAILDNNPDLQVMRKKVPFFPPDSLFFCSRLLFRLDTPAMSMVRSNTLV